MIKLKELLNEAKDMAFVDYLKVLDDKFLDGMKAVRGDNGSDAQIKPTRGDILQNFTLFRNYLSALTKKYKGDKTKLRFLTERANRLNEIIKLVNEVIKNGDVIIFKKSKGEVPKIKYNSYSKQFAADFISHTDYYKNLKDAITDMKNAGFVIDKYIQTESVNEGIEPQIKKIAYYTGTRPEAVEDFVSKHGLNITKLLKFVEKGKLPERMAIVSALAGNPGNPVQKKIIKQFSESVNEESYKVAGKPVTLIKGKKSNGTDWKVKFQNGKETSLSDVLSLIKPFPKGIKESVNEANGTYFKAAYEAAEYAKEMAEKKGFEIDEDDWQTQIGMGGKHNRLRPGVGKTHSFSVGLTKNGKPQRKALNISLYGMDSGSYELTYYIN